MGTPATSEFTKTQEPSGKLTFAMQMAISDLFFNLRHDEYDGADTDEAKSAALLKDANELVSWFSILGIKLEADELVADFLHRL